MTLHLHEKVKNKTNLFWPTSLKGKSGSSNIEENKNTSKDEFYHSKQLTMGQNLPEQQGSLS